MPFTAAQLERILAPDLIPQARVPHRATRIAESYLKRRLFAWEESSVAAQHALYEAFYTDLRSHALDAADRWKVTTIGSDMRASLVRSSIIVHATISLDALKQSLLAVARDRIETAWLAGYYGRAWLLDVATTPDVTIAIPPPNPLREALSDDDLIRLLGREWVEAYALEMDALLLSIRRALNTSMTQGKGMLDAMRAVRDAMGISTDRRNQRYRQNFNRVQVLTRTYIMDASNAGATAAYRANSDVLSGYEWLTARDERVCPECAPLNGTVYPLSSYYRPPKHPQCRCTVVPVVDEALLVPREEPPRQTLGEWLLAQGISAVLQSFLIGGARSERV